MLLQMQVIFRSRQILTGLMQNQVQRFKTKQLFKEKNFYQGVMEFMF